MAAIRDLSGSDWESVSLMSNPKFIALIEESRRSYREEGGIAIEDARQTLGLPKPKPKARRKKRD